MNNRSVLVGSLILVVTMAASSCVRDLNGEVICSSSGLEEGVYGEVLGVVDGNHLEVDIEGKTETVVLQNVRSGWRGGSDEVLDCVGSLAEEYLEKNVDPGDTVRIIYGDSKRNDYGEIPAAVYLGDKMLNSDIAYHGLGAPESRNGNDAFEGEVAHSFDNAASSRSGFFDPDISCTIPALAESASTPMEAQRVLDELDEAAEYQVWIQNMISHPGMNDSMGELRRLAGEA